MKKDGAVKMENSRISDREKVPDEAADLLSGRGWRAVRRVGRGAFCEVYLVTEKKTGRFAACKVSKKKELARRESDLLAAAAHPLFPEFYGLWEQGENAYLLMEYIWGGSLEDYLRQRGRFCAGQTVRVGIELAQGIRFLHQLPDPMLYRDLKPANVMIRQDGRVRLLDMGCACRLRRPDGSRAGTPGFAAPEQLREGGVLSPASDVYGLGKLLERMAGDGARGRLGQVIAACTMPAPEDRLPDMQEVTAALLSLCGDARARAAFPGRMKYGGHRIRCIGNVWESGYKNG